MDSLPTECYNTICVHLELSDLARLASSCKGHASRLTISTTSTSTASKSNINNNNELWNLLLCQRLWTVDPTAILFQQQQEQEQDEDQPVGITTSTTTSIDWNAQFRTMIQAEQANKVYLTNLKEMDLDGWIERHFLGQLAEHWNGWERRFWAWSSHDNSFSAFADDTKTHCYATFPVSSRSVVRRVSPEEQIILSLHADSSGQNPVTDPRPFVFTLTNTAFPMLWACRSEEQLQVWLDKISVTLHPLQFEGKTYQAPAKYVMTAMTADGQEKGHYPY